MSIQPSASELCAGRPHRREGRHAVLRLTVCARPGHQQAVLLIRHERAAVKTIEALIADGGNITIYPITRATTAAESHNAIGILIRLDGEALNALPKRLDRAIGPFYEHEEITDRINPP